MACDPKTLAGDGCWNCLMPDQKLTALCALACQILQALDPMATCDPKTLAGDGCWNCLMPDQKANALLALLCEIKDSIGGLATTCCYSGDGSPEGVVTAAVGSTYTQTDAAGVLWVKVTGAGNTGWAVNS